MPALKQIQRLVAVAVAWSLTSCGGAFEARRPDATRAPSTAVNTPGPAKVRVLESEFAVQERDSEEPRLVVAAAVVRNDGGAKHRP